jgi:hypothetical protein
MTIPNTLPGLSTRIAGGIKIVYRGTTGGAMTVTLPGRVDPSKSIVLSCSKGSAGTVAATGSVAFGSLTLTPSGGTPVNPLGGPQATSGGSFPSYAGSGSGAITGGTTDLTVKVFSAVLSSDGSQITTDGAVEYQVVEFV